MTWLPGYSRLSRLYRPINKPIFCFALSLLPSSHAAQSWMTKLGKTKQQCCDNVPLPRNYSLAARTVEC